MATANGGVIKTRSVARVLASSRWDSEMVLNIEAIPTHLNLGSPEEIDFKLIEESKDPHRHVDDVERDQLEDDQPAGENMELSEKSIKTLDKQIRITRADMDMFGSTPGCPRCANIELGLYKTKRMHSHECRLRMYLAGKGT